MFLTKVCQSLYRNNIIKPVFLLPNANNRISAITPERQLSLGFINRCEQNEEPDTSVDPSKDRTKIIPVETSIRYLKSQAYAEAYGDNPVWKLYRRNHKGQLAPIKTRATCIRKGKIATGNPCPICRDEYLVLHEENVELLKQFISPYNGATLSYSVTGVCQKKHRELLVAIEIAKDRGLIEFDLPFKVYDYSLYNKN